MTAAGWTDELAGLAQRREPIDLPDANVWPRRDVELLNVVSAVLGSVAGLPAFRAVLAHFNFMTAETSRVFAGVPPVVKAVTGAKIDKFRFGWCQVHPRISGVIDNVATDEEHAVAQIRRFLSYLPSSVYELPPRSEPTPPDVESGTLNATVPLNPRQIRETIAAIVDEGSLVEIAPHHSCSRVTALGRMAGFPVAAMANEPTHLGDATDVGAHGCCRSTSSAIRCATPSTRTSPPSASTDDATRSPATGRRVHRCRVDQSIVSGAT